MDLSLTRKTQVNIQGAFDLYQKSVKKILKDKKTGWIGATLSDKE